MQAHLDYLMGVKIGRGFASLCVRDALGLLSRGSRAEMPQTEHIALLMALSAAFSRRMLY